MMLSVRHCLQHKNHPLAEGLLNPNKWLCSHPEMLLPRFELYRTHLTVWNFFKHGFEFSHSFKPSKEFHVHFAQFTKPEIFRATRYLSQESLGWDHRWKLNVTGIGLEATTAESQEYLVGDNNIILKWPHTLSQTVIFCFQMEGGFNEKDTE